MGKKEKGTDNGTFLQRKGERDRGDRNIMDIHMYM